MHVDSDKAPPFVLRNAIADAPIPEEAKEDITRPFITTKEKAQEMSFPSDAPALEDDPRMRVFDEL